MCYNVCKKYRKFKITKMSCIKPLIYQNIKPFIVYSKCGNEYKKVFKEEESMEMLKILELINNIAEYQKIYNHP